MKITKKIAFFLLLCFLLYPLAQTKAAASATFTLSSTTGDAVQVNVTGEPSSTVYLSFLPQGASSITSVAFGTTNASGNFTTTVSSGGYGIPAGSPAYVTVNGMQSQTILWPSYTSSITFSKNTAQVAIGQYTTITSAYVLVLAANSLTSGIGASVSSGQVVITGLANGSGTLTLCSANVGCGYIAVNVGGQGQTQVTFSENNIVLNSGVSKNIDIFGGGSNGFSISSNSNQTAVSASISGKVGIVSLYGNKTPGTATIVICSNDDSSNCANLNLTVLNTAISVLSFSQNNLNLTPGLSQTVIVSGGPDNNYYIASNSNSGAANVTVSGNIVSIVGGSSYGKTVISVCSASVNATCGSLNVTLNTVSSVPSADTLAFSQNVVSVAAEDNTLVTVSGGTGTGYTISANSSSTVAAASITGSSNVINIHGIKTGSTIVTVCSATAGAACASLYVNVGPALTPIVFSRNSVSLTDGQTSVVVISGGTGTGKTISNNTNTSVVTALLNNDGNILTLTGGNTSGSAVVTICAASYSNNCASINITSTKSAAAPDSSAPSSTVDTSTASSVSTQSQLQNILSDASAVYRGTGFIKNAALESKIITAYAGTLSAASVGSAAKEKIINFIAYGSSATISLGEGERAGVVGSYSKAFGKLPATESEWADVIKIANGRWPSEASTKAIDSAKTEFKKVYKRNADMSNANDNAAITIIAYGLRPTNRNTNSEKAAIKIFKSVYGHNPVSSLAWDIVRAVAYSGAQR